MLLLREALIGGRVGAADAPPPKGPFSAWEIGPCPGLRHEKQLTPNHTEAAGRGGHQSPEAPSWFSNLAMGTHGGIGPTTDGRNPAPPKKPWNVDSPVNTNKQWCQPWLLKWCETDFATIHSIALGTVAKRYRGQELHLVPSNHRRRALSLFSGSMTQVARMLCRKRAISSQRRLGPKEKKKTNKQH